MATDASSLKLVPRRSAERGHGNLQWLQTYHTFSFASYNDDAFERFGVLRVINEDRVRPTRGFGFHRHANFEIWSYIVSGRLEHQDSEGNFETLERGDIQMTSTGSGISHSEFNRNKSEEVHFCQIWAVPDRSGLKPQYYTRHFTDQEKRGKLVKVVAPVDDADTKDVRAASGPAPVHNKLTMWASILPAESSVEHTVSGKTYIHLIMHDYFDPKSAPGSQSARVRVGGAQTEPVDLAEGDGLFIESSDGGAGRVVIESVGARDAEFLLFDV